MEVLYQKDWKVAKICHGNGDDVMISIMISNDLQYILGKVTKV